MSGKPQFRWFTADQLIAAAGGDPWEIADQLHAGDAGAINDLAGAFHSAGSHVKDADDQFNKAKQQFKDAYNRNNGSEHPINDAAEVQRMSALLAGHPEELTKIAANLQQTAAALATAQRDSAAEIAELNAALHSIDDEINSYGPQIPVVLGQLIDEAEAQTAMSLGVVANVQGAYVDQLHSAETALLKSGYVPDELDDADAVPDNSAKEAAEKYEKSGQLEKDRATVQKYEREHRTGNDLGAQDAKQRLQDYDSVMHPEKGAARFGDAQEREEAGWLAGKRLDDWNVANSTGPVAKDPILGGDMRDRANKRLEMQRQLQTGQLGFSPLPMSADDATRMLDGLEVQDQTAALARLQEQLVGAGVSAAGAKSITDAYARGIVPPMTPDQKAGFENAGDAYGVTSDGYKALRELENQLGLTPSDVDALKKVGKTLGHVSSALDWGVALYEVASGEKTFAHASMEVGGSLAGAWMLGEPMAAAGLAIGGPVGAFVLGAPAAVVGGWMGEAGADKVYEYFTSRS